MADDKIMQEWMERAGTVSHDEANEIAKRYNASHFDRPGMGEKARYSIPADPRRDDDIRMRVYIAQNAAKDAEIAALRQRAEKAEADRDRLAGVVERFKPAIEVWPVSFDGHYLIPGMILKDGNGDEHEVAYVAIEKDTLPSTDGTEEWRRAGGLLGNAGSVKHGRFRWWVCSPAEAAKGGEDGTLARASGS